MATLTNYAVVVVPVVFIFIIIFKLYQYLNQEDEQEE